MKNRLHLDRYNIQQRDFTSPYCEWQSSGTSTLEMAHKNVFMLIDDDEDDRDIFLSVLLEIAPEVECLIGTNGHDGLARLRSFSRLPQLIFLDLNMPLMDGKQFLVEIKKTDLLKNIPVVILSTSSDRDTIAQTRALGAIDFITKPDRYSDWEEVLKRMIL